MLVLLAVLPSWAASAQEWPYPDSGIRWAQSPGIPPLTISGIVIEMATGKPLGPAIVSFPGTGYGVLTDSVGRFTLKAPRAGKLLMTVAKIGYLRAEDSIDVSLEAGLISQVGLELQPDCEVMLHGSLVSVRDLITGLAPSTSVSVRVRNDTSVVSANRPGWASTIPHLTLDVGGGLSTLGPFDVEVTASGYVPWKASNIWRVMDLCGVDKSPPLRVWLMPIDGL